MELWIGFLVGVLARWGDRAQFIISETADRSFFGYVERNWGRLLIRMLVSLYIFHLMLGQGWVTSEFIAFSIGISSDTITESFVDRAKKRGGSLVKGGMK